MKFMQFLSEMIKMNLFLISIFQGIQKKLELVFVKHYAPNCLTLTLFDSNTA